MRKTPYLAFVVFMGFVGAWLGYALGARYGLNGQTGAGWDLIGGRGAILSAVGMSLVFVAVSGVLVLYVPGRKIRRAMENGVPASAEILSIEPTGDESVTPDGTFSQIRCELEVRPRGLEAYTTSVTQFVSEEYERRLRVGSTVQVRYVPAKPENVAIVEPRGTRR